MIVITSRQIYSTAWDLVLFHVFMCIIKFSMISVFMCMIKVFFSVSIVFCHLMCICRPVLRQVPVSYLVQ